MNVCVIRSIIFLILWFLWTLIFGVVSSPILLLPKKSPIISLFGRIWAKFTLTLLRVICGIRERVIGKENIPKQPYIIASKHQSAWETIFFLLLFKDPVFVIKKELTKIPIYGWYLSKIGMIIIDRKGGSNALKQIKAGAQEAINSGRSVIIFPEGTRTSPGSRVQYKSGVSFLKDNFNIPIVPVAINAGLYWINKSIIRKSGVITVKVLPTFIPKEKFLNELQELIDSESEKLL